MTIDYAHPLPADLYDSATQPDVLEYIRDNMVANAKWLEGMDPAGKQTGFKRINSGLLQEWNGSAWVNKPLAYVPKAGAIDITGSLGIQATGSAIYSVNITDAPANKKITAFGGNSLGESYFARSNDALSAWTAGMRIGADGKVYDIASGLPFVTTNPVGAYLPLTGGTLTGSLTIAPPAGNVAPLFLNSPSSGFNAAVWYQTNGFSRWSVTKDAIAETGGNSGSDFRINRFNDAGSLLGTVLTIARSDGLATFANNVTVSGAFTVSGQTTLANINALATNINGALNVQSNLELGSLAVSATPFIDFHSSATMNDYDARIICSGGTATNGNGTLSLQAALTKITQAVEVGFGYNFGLIASNGARKSLYCDNAGTLGIGNNANSQTIATLSDTGRFAVLDGYNTRAGIPGPQGGNCFNFQWTGSALQGWVDSSNLGNVSFTSDERVKHQIEPMPLLAEEAFARIKPIRFHWADVGIFKDDGQTHWGFSAQNIKAVLPEALVGDTKAVQENGDPQPASIDDRAILGQCVRQIQAINARLTAAGLKGV